MTVKEVMKIAKSKNMKKLSGYKKADLIRNIQQVEGNFTCFGTMQNSFCDQSECIWMKDCTSTSNNVNRA